MVEAILYPTKPLHDVADFVGNHVSITEIHDLQMVGLAAPKGGADHLRRMVRQSWGLDLPQTPRRVASETLGFIWAGPQRWMVTSQRSGDLAQELRRGLGDCIITDQTDSRSLLRVSGQKSREVLMKLLSIDLHPRVFGPGHTALTMAAHVNLQIWQLDDAPSYELCVFRSYADYFHHALRSAAAAV